jgi:prolipoprotein diacylglyceryltransferase
VIFRWRRDGRHDAFVLVVNLVLAGGIRFAIEFVRINERVVGPLAVAHPASMLAMVIGFMFLLRSRVDASDYGGVLAERET